MHSADSALTSTPVRPCIFAPGAQAPGTLQTKALLRIAAPCGQKASSVRNRSGGQAARVTKA